MPINFTDEIPATYETAVDTILAQMTEAEERELFEAGHSAFHHTVGRAIRNDWGLWHGSKLKEHFIQEFGLGHADDMSSLILKGVEMKIKQLYDWSPDDLAGEYRKYWTDKGIDPVTQEYIES